MQADYNSFQAPALQIEQKFQASQQPSKIQQYRWMYNHWPDEVDVAKNQVLLVGAETAEDSLKPKVELAKMELLSQAQSANADSVDTTPVSERAQSRQTVDKQSPARVIGVAPKELPPFEAPTHPPSHETASGLEHWRLEQPVIEQPQTVIREVPDAAIRHFANRQAEDLRADWPDQSTPASVPSPPPEQSPFAQRWSYKQGSDRPMTAASTSTQIEHTSEAPRDLIQRFPVKQTINEEGTAQSGPLRVINSPQSPAWWGAQSATSQQPTSKGAAPIVLEDDEDYSVEGMFEIR